ncbi:hypothetical protein ACN47E_005122 [Coniothyrium glycines]
MPRFLQPRHSTQHRVAAIALYRALLSRCSSVPLLDDDRSSLRNAIRNKFRKNRKIQSTYQLGLSFKAGYETLDQLDASSMGNNESQDLLSRLISRLPRRLTHAPPPLCARKTADEPPKEMLACLPPERAVLNVRPYAKVSGPRQVPILASANGVPFLRLTKPQPRALSRILRQRLDHKIVLFDRKVLLNNWWLPMCRHEDQWDALIDSLLPAHGDNISWTDAVRLAQKENQDAYERDVAKDRIIATKMQRIVDQETALALKEGQTIVRGRRRRPILIMKPQSNRFNRLPSIRPPQHRQ